MTREIMLNAGQVALVDDEDYESVMSVGMWTATRSSSGYTFYACRRAPRAVRDQGGSTVIRMHTFLTGLPLVDHVNRNGLDNRRINLRPATRSQNAANAGFLRNNTSGYRGVSWHRATKKWGVQLIARGRKFYLGEFADPIEAAHAYDAAANREFGEYATLNFPQTGDGNNV